MSALFTEPIKSLQTASIVNKKKDINQGATYFKRLMRDCHQGALQLHVHLKKQEGDAFERSTVRLGDKDRKCDRGETKHGRRRQKDQNVGKSELYKEGG